MDRPGVAAHQLGLGRGDLLGRAAVGLEDQVPLGRELAELRVPFGLSMVGAPREGDGTRASLLHATPSSASADRSDPYRPENV